MTISKSKLIADYIEAKSGADYYKKLENELRVKIVETMFPTAGEGTHNMDFGDVEIKATVRFNYKFDAKELEDLEGDFNEMEAACVKRKPSLDVTKYKSLSESDKQTIDEAVVITPGLPTLVVKEVA